MEFVSDDKRTSWLYMSTEFSGGICRKSPCEIAARIRPEPSDAGIRIKEGRNFSMAFTSSNTLPLLRFT
jgi:hypothetical protein